MCTYIHLVKKILPFPIFQYLHFYTTGNRNTNIDKNLHSNIVVHVLNYCYIRSWGFITTLRYRYVSYDLEI